MGLKGTLLRVLPGGVTFEMNRLRRKYAPNQRHREQRELLALLGNPCAVMQGPFKGMKYLSTTAAANLVDDLMGTYELELHPAIERLIRYVPDVVVDVGTATGYYAIGMALRVPGARVIGYDISPYARAVTRRLAAKNSVGNRVEVLGECSPAELSRVLAGAKRPVVISDCEGYEDVLIDPTKVPELHKTYMLVELHDMFVPETSKRIRERFEVTHTIEKFVPRKRIDADLPPGVKFTQEQLVRSMDEAREASSAWYEMRPQAVV